jgi:hypothetical protein
LFKQHEGQEYRMAEIIILAERRKARQERRATNVMAMPFALMGRIHGSAANVVVH